MKKVKEVKEVYATIRLKRNLLVIGYPNAEKEEVDFVSPVEGGIYRTLGELIFYSETTFEPVNIYTIMFDLVDTLPKLNLSSSFTYDNKLFLASKDTKTHFTYDGTSLFDTKELKKANQSINNKLFRFLGEDIARYDINNHLIWQKDISSPEYGVFKDIDGKVYANKLASPAMADDDTIYLSMKGGQIIALNETDGSTKWMLEDGKSARCVLYKNLIYKNTGNELIVIDTKKVKEIQRIHYYNDYNNEYGMTGEFNVYEDVIVMKSMSNGQVSVINRHNLQLLGSIVLENGIKNTGANCTVWHNNYLYAIDGNFTMHIYELDNHKVNKIA